MPAELRLCEDVSSAQWVVDRIHGFGMDVGGVIPEGFDTYLRLFHPASRARGEALVRWAEIAATNGRTVHPEMQWPNISGVFEHTQSPQPSLWDDEPDVGTLPQDHALRLAEILALHTDTPDRVWFCVWQGWGALKVHGQSPSFQILRSGGGRRRRLWRPVTRARHRQVPAAPTVHLPNRQYYLFEGPIKAITESVNHPPSWQSASLWWPDDRAWCVATEIDFAWTYVGGTADCIQDVSSDPEFESLPARIDHGITYAGDKQNPSPRAD